MRTSANIQHEIKEVKDRQARLLDERADLHSQQRDLERQRGEAVLDGDEVAVPEVNRKLEDLRKRDDDLQDGVTAANLRIERLEQEFQETRAAEAMHVFQAVRLQEFEKLLEYRLIEVRAQEEQAKLEPEIGRLYRIARHAWSKVTRDAQFREWTGTTGQLEAEIARLRAEVGNISKDDRKTIEELAGEIVQEEADRAKGKRRLALEAKVESKRRARDGARLQLAEANHPIAGLNESAEAHQERRVKNAEAAVTRTEREYEEAEAELASIGA